MTGVVLRATSHRPYRFERQLMNIIEDVAGFLLAYVEFVLSLVFSLLQVSLTVAWARPLLYLDICVCVYIYIYMYRKIYIYRYIPKLPMLVDFVFHFCGYKQMYLKTYIYIVVTIDVTSSVV